MYALFITVLVLLGGILGLAGSPDFSDASPLISQSMLSHMRASITLECGAAVSATAVASDL